MAINVLYKANIFLVYQYTYVRFFFFFFFLPLEEIQRKKNSLASLITGKFYNLNSPYKVWDGSFLGK